MKRSIAAYNFFQLQENKRVAAGTARFDYTDLRDPVDQRLYDAIAHLANVAFGAALGTT